ncbi:MAG: alanine--tRNA ligase [Planctomycetota bacterium]|jgi:alanyl-tRNA synthetase
MKTQAAIRTAAEIRRDFIDYFAGRHGHAFVASSPVAPHDDPTLLFANAGMNQFKDVFLDQGTRDYTRAVNSQKCIRAGGKHNDLEDVGKDHYHHTFFEMLGNWSFGDYFKAEAIEWAWELLTGPRAGWGLDKDRLYVTVFAGDQAEGLEPDTEAEAIWKRFVGPKRISRWGKKDNFWEMGETGPCGPCSEIHYDFTPDKTGAALVNAGDPHVIELWNLVFIQYNRAGGGQLSPLPSKHVDTGMGLERLVRILQNAPGNYDTDLWRPIFRDIESHTGAHPYGGSLDDPVDVAYRVIADHVRCLTVAITDGAWPSNDGRGYVLRRILRRAVRHAHQTLGVQGPLLCDLVPGVVESLGDAFPELKERPSKVAEVIRDEEESFLNTLDRGLALFAEAVERLRGQEATLISAGDAFRLHDTYGFPIDLTRVMAEERGLAVDEAGYAQLMEEARERSRQAGGDEESIILPSEAIARLKDLGTPPTLDGDKFEAEPLSTEVLAIFNGRDFDETARLHERVALIVERTNHYAEAGGQVGDRGTIETEAGDGPRSAGDCRFEVEHTESFGGYVLHVGRVIAGALHKGDRVTVTVDRERRRLIRANHTATHLLNLALREAIGEEENQKGSLVAPDRLRFDFSCPHAMSQEQIEQTERMVNGDVERKLDVYAEILPLAVAMSITGVRAVFGEKYPDPVRVVSIGIPLGEVNADPSNERWRGYSIELCGGTHLRQTAEAGRFVIINEQALAAGVRRITALTGAAAEAAESAGQALMRRAEHAARVDGDRVVEEFSTIIRLLDEQTIGTVARSGINALLEPLRQRVKTIRKAQQAEARAGVVDQARRIASAGAGPVIVDRVFNADRDSLLAAMDAIRAKHGGAAVMVLAADEVESKVMIAARVPEALVERGLKAGDWVREAARICGGRGGGRADMAQAGGKDPARVPDAIAASKAYAEQVLG